MFRTEEEIKNFVETSEKKLEVKSDKESLFSSYFDYYYLDFLVAKLLCNSKCLYETILNVTYQLLIEIYD